MDKDNDKLNEAAAPSKQTADTGKLSKLKLWLLYVLVGGLVAAAIIAIVAVLVGEFSTVLQKALGTIFVFVTHSLFILGLVYTDKHNRLGRSIIPTTLLAVALASTVTLSLGIWEAIDGDASYHSTLFYVLIVGSAFLATVALHPKLQNKIVKTLSYVALGSIIAWAIMMTPWIFAVVEDFNQIYFRIVIALSILVATSLLILFILRMIIVGRDVKLHEKIKAERKATKIHGGLLAYYIVIGIIVFQIWLVWVVNFTSDAYNQSRGESWDSTY